MGWLGWDDLHCHQDLLAQRSNVVASSEAVRKMAPASPPAGKMALAPPAVEGSWMGPGNKWNVSWEEKEFQSLDYDEMIVAKKKSIS